MRMPRSFRDAFLDAVKRPGWTIRRVAEVSGVSEEQLKKLNQGRSQRTNVDDALKVANAFGFTLDEFLEDRLAEDRDAAVGLWLQLSEAERDILLAAARGRHVPDRVEGQ